MENRTIYHGNNLEYLQVIPDNTFDGIVSDPPFNTGTDFDLGFSDKWGWNAERISELEALRYLNFPVYRYIHSLRRDDPKRGPYLAFMAIRAYHERRILKEDGAIFVFCDDTEGAYLINVYDRIFGSANQRNVISYKRNTGEKGGKCSPNAFARNTGLILFYAKSDKFKLNTDHKYREMTQQEFEKKYDRVDEYGQRFRLDTLKAGPKYAKNPNLYYDFYGLKRPWYHRRQKMEELLVSGQLAYRQDGDFITIRDADHILELSSRKPNQAICKRMYPRMENGKGTVVLDNLWSDLKREESSKMQNGGHSAGKTEEQIERLLSFFKGREGETWILDPFLGLGTTAIVAERFKFKWVGMEFSEQRILVTLGRFADKKINETDLKDPNIKARYLESISIYTDSDNLPFPKVVSEVPESPWNLQKLLSPEIVFGRFFIEDSSVNDDTDFTVEQKKVKWIEQNYTCNACYCGLYPWQIIGDHIKPRAKGGKTTMDNLQVLCSSCNIRKGDLDWDTFLSRLNDYGIYQLNREEQSARIEQDLIAIVDPEELPILDYLRS